MSKQIDIDRELLFRMYHTEGTPAKEIAKRLNLSYSCVYNNIERYKIPINPKRKLKIPEDKLRELYVDKCLSLNKIAKIFKTEHRTVMYRLKDMGIPIKTRKEIACKGENHYHWKGGKVKDGRTGYVAIRLSPSDPYYSMAKNSWSYVPEHRYIMAKHIGRCLTSNEVVHHLNGVRHDNRIKNLGIVNRSNHSHHTLQTQLQERIRELESELAQQKLL